MSAFDRAHTTLTVLVKLRLVTDRQADTRRQDIPRKTRKQTRIEIIPIALPSSTETMIS